MFAANNQAVTPDETGVYGIISLVFWAITSVVSVKYVTFIMRADNQGEGGIMALIALLEGVSLRSRAAKAALVALGIFGAALFYGDGMITPAISVLSAVEGIQVAAPSLDSLVLPITLTVLTALFSIQRFGTGVVGRLFGPVMAVWFGVLALAGAVEVIQTRRSSRRSRPRTESPSSSTTEAARSWLSARLCWRSPAPKLSMPTWATSAARPSAGRGSFSCFPPSPSTTWAREL